jgi:superfamily II DNA or RNA helicase
MVTTTNNAVETDVVTEDIDIGEFYGEKSLRWYQVAARNELVEHLQNGVKRIVIELPTGAGKTLTFACAMSYPEVRRCLGVTSSRPLRVLFIAHKHRLLTQAEKTFTVDSNVELITQSAFSDIPQSLYDKGWDVTIIDECHHEAMMSIQLHLERIANMPIIGLSATVDRADGMLIKFEKFIKPISREQAVREGFLAPTQLYSFVDAPAKDKTFILKDMFDSYADQMGQTMVFVRTKREVGIIAEYLKDQGYTSVAVLGQSEKELDKILNDFSKGVYQFIVNCNKINEGVDVAGCESVVLGRQFGSYPQLNQVIGRAARPDSECRVWELINPLSGYNLDTTVIVGTPETHKLVYRKNGQWNEEVFDYTTEHVTDFGNPSMQDAHSIVGMVR